MIEYTIQKNDTLSGIAQRFLGDARKWHQLWTANVKTLEAEQNKTARKIRNMSGPNWIFPGVKIKIPTPRSACGAKQT